MLMSEKYKQNSRDNCLSSLHISIGKDRVHPFKANFSEKGM